MNAQGKRVDEVGPLPELSICQSGRKVYILLDANADSNAAVQQARAALAQQLRKQRADVRVLELPAMEGVNGPDDYLAVCGGEALSKLIADTESGAAILDLIQKFIRRYVIITNAQSVVITVWVVHTYLMRIAKTTPYLSIYVAGETERQDPTSGSVGGARV